MSAPVSKEKSTEKPPLTKKVFEKVSSTHDTSTRPPEAQSQEHGTHFFLLDWMKLSALGVSLAVVLFITNQSRPLKFHPQKGQATYGHKINWLYHGENAPVLRFPILRDEAFKVFNPRINSSPSQFPNNDNNAMMQEPLEQKAYPNDIEMPSGYQEILDELIDLTGRQPGVLHTGPGVVYDENFKIWAFSLSKANEVFGHTVEHQGSYYDVRLVAEGDGILIRTSPSEQQSQKQFIAESLRTVTFPDRTLDEYYRKYPSLITYPILLGFIALGYLLFVRLKKKQEVLENATDCFASDKPIQRAEDDLLGFSALAMSVSKFLRHSCTVPPLTLAITGPWGKGKSSLMRLIQADLAKVGTSPVWINAWHHQNEEQFLYGVLEVLKNEALPDVMSSSGIFFRLRLMLARFVRLTLAKRITVFFVLLLPLSVPFLPYRPLVDNEYVAGLISLVFPVATLWGFSREKLTTYLKQGRKQLFGLGSLTRSLDSNSGIRHKFATEFKNICYALGNQRLTIFVDDLDRCSEPRIMEVLEAVNFLVSSGPCYVIFGMAEEPVKRAIGNHYRELFQDYEFKNEDEKNDHLRKLADDYLEKIINITIPVPGSKPQQSRELIVENNNEVRTWSRSMLIKPLLIVVSALFALLFLFRAYIPERTIADKGGVGPVLHETETIDPAEDLAGRNVILAGNRLSTIKLMTGLSILVAGFGVVIFRFCRFGKKLEAITIKENPEFTDALNDRLPLLAEFKNQPRNLKRYINRTRFYNLRNDADGDDRVMSVKELTCLSMLHELLGSTLWEAKDTNDRLTDLQENEFFPLEPDRVSDIEATLGEAGKILNNDTKASFFKYWVTGVSIR